MTRDEIKAKLTEFLNNNGLSTTGRKRYAKEIELAGLGGDRELWGLFRSAVQRGEDFERQQYCNYIARGGTSD